MAGGCPPLTAQCWDQNLGHITEDRLSTNDLASRRTLRPGRKPGFPVGEYLC